MCVCVCVCVDKALVVRSLQELAEEIGRSRAFVQAIRNDSSDIVSVIRQAYEVK